MVTRYRLTDADTGQDVETFDPLTISLAKGDPFLCQTLNALAREVLSAYCDAKHARHPGLCRTHKMLLNILKKNPWIRRLRPRPNRLLIHMGDFAKYLIQKGAPDLRHMPATDVDALLALRAEREIQRRVASERRKKIRRG
jgi:hypothetical protein